MPLLNATALRALVAAAIFPISSFADPLDHVAAYSLEITSEGPTPYYVPIGMRPGLPALTVQAGFNLWQTEFTPLRIKKEGVLEPGIDLRLEEYQAHGLMSYAQIRGALSLSRGRPTVPGVIGEFGEIPPSYPRGKEPGGKGLASVNVFSPATVKYLRRVAEEVALKIGTAEPPGKPLVFWGLDNEYEGFTDYSPQAREAFDQWVEQTYSGDLARLNQAWDLSLSSFEESRAIPAPELSSFAAKPGLFLDYHTFQSDYFTRLQADLAHRIHNADPYRRGVVFKSTQQTIEMPVVNRLRIFDHALFADLVRDVSGGLYGVNIYGSGDRQAYETSFAFNAIRAPDRSGVWGVMYPETNNHSGPGQQWAASFWRYMNSGLKAVNFFCTGYPGAKKDYASFGHVGPDGKLRDKMFYAARWAGMIHRTERFWREAMPAEAAPRVAIFVPRRDVILAKTTDRLVSRWAYPSNHRWMIFKWLREQGYWVDALPYTKLTTSYLSGYQALLLCGAEHLTKAEAAAVADYVAQGGVLLSDERPGFFDEHHLPSEFLSEVIGIQFGKTSGNGYVPVGNSLPGFATRGVYEATLGKATRPWLARDDGSPLVTEHAHGKGKSLHFFGQLGSLRARRASTAAPVSTFKGEGGETADPVLEEVESAHFEESRWLASLLQYAGVHPAYRAKSPGADLRILRVETPFMDAAGNVAFSVGTRGTAEPRERVPAGEVELWLPPGPWSATLIGPAEHAGLEPIALLPGEKGRYRLQLPELSSAAMVYLFRDHPPVIGIPKIESQARAIDGQTARISEGTPFQVRVTIFNPSPRPLAVGNLRLLARQGWNVSPESVASATLPPGGDAEWTFSITPHGSAEALKEDWLYPLVARWADDTGKDRAVGAAHVQIIPAQP